MASYLTHSPPINITKFYDNQGFTLLHLAVFRNSYPITQFLCEYVLSKASVSKEFKRSQVLKKWINQQTLGEEGFTSLHYSSFNGNLKISRFLIQNGADYTITNRHRINMMHVAA